MKPAPLIEDVRTRLLRIPPTSTWEDATHAVAELEFVVVELRCAGDVGGLGLAYTVGVGGSAIAAIVADYCRQPLLGQDVRDVAKLWRRLAANLHRTGGGPARCALAAVDVALWDASARERDWPLHRVLGAVRDDVPAYFSGIDYALDPGRLGATIADAVARGYEAVKIKVGRPTLGEDLGRIAAAREALGPDRSLMLDANQSWRLDEALRRVRAFERFDPAWIEEPLAAEDIAGHTRLARATGVPIALGESLYDAAAFLAYLRAGALDVLQPDVVRVGGITPWMRIAQLAEAWERPVAPHYMAELSVAPLCAAPNALILEDVTGGGLVELGLLDGPPVVTSGRAAPRAAAGHGFALAPGAERFEVDRAGGWAAAEIAKA